MTEWKALLGAGALSLAASLPAAAVTLNVVDGQLIGASGVTVATAAGAKTYTVEFLDGSCATLFTNCGAADAAARPFAFTTSADATAASQALLDQVITGVYKTEPERTNGCSSRTFCTVLTPFALSSDAVETAGLRNLRGPVGASISTFSFDAFGIASGTATYARWSEVTPIPLPAGAPLVLSGLAALAGLRWQKRRARRRAQV